MYAYVDESGHTGLNLFDPDQPVLFYGLLVCRKNLDLIAEPMLKKLRTELGVDRLHAAQLGAKALIPVAKAFDAFQRKHDIRWGFYKVYKRDHAVISFFDQLFDSGMNDAVSWHQYWTPIRYVLLMKVAYLFDEELARKAWDARLIREPHKCAAQLVEICEEIRERVPDLPDTASQEVIDGAMQWAIARPEEIDYGVSNKDTMLMVSPNMIGFQYVLQGIAEWSKKLKRDVRSIVVDRQTQFNKAQGELAEIYRLIRGTNFSFPPGMPNYDWSHMPDISLSFTPGDESAGLEMVDTYLWLQKRVFDKKELPSDCFRLLYNQRHRGRTDELSLSAISERWKHTLDLPMPEGEQLEKAQGYLDSARAERERAIKAVSEQT